MKIESDERGRKAQQSPARRERAHDDRVLSPMMPFSRPLDNTRFTNCNLLTKNGKVARQHGLQSMLAAAGKTALVHVAAGKTARGKKVL